MGKYITFFSNCPSLVSEVNLTLNFLDGLIMHMLGSALSTFNRILMRTSIYLNLYLIGIGFQ